jgi:hypothetical protein
MRNNKVILDRAGHCDYFARTTVKVVAGWQVARKTESTAGMTLIMPVIFATIHLTWGSSFLLRLLGPKSSPRVV